MHRQQIRVTFQPLGRSVYVLKGTKVLEAAAQAGLTLDTPCGGVGLCGKCRVQITEGLSAPAQADLAIFSKEELAAGWRLACQTAICNPCVIYVPDTSIFADQHQILTSAKTAMVKEIQPAVRKIYVELGAATAKTAEACLRQLEERLGPLTADLPFLRSLPELLRHCDFAGTAVLADHRLIDFEPGETTGRCYGAAFDIGTTTLAAALLDLNTAAELAVMSAINPQVRYGDDVLSRIKHAATPAGLKELNRSIIDAINEMILAMCKEAAIERTNIYEIALAGNTTMEHLLCGLDVSSLGGVPFTPASKMGMMLPAAEMGIDIHPRAGAYVFPIIGGFVGGDAVAGALVTRLAEAAGSTLMVDIGTNGEIMLASGGRMWAASTAAGPAFEGARISCGMRGAAGAIEKVVLDSDLRFGVIGDVEPLGLCGSGLIDLAAELLTLGIVTPAGRMLPPKELPPALPPAIASRVRLDSAGETHFVLVEDRGLSLTQRDVRELQLASAAIHAGISILLRHAGTSAGDLQCVLIAGGFGSFIRRSNAQRIGLLPSGIDHRCIHYVGNTSLAGAKWALLSTVARLEGEKLAQKIAHVELSRDANFQNEFAEAMIFPSRS